MRPRAGKLATGLCFGLALTFVAWPVRSFAQDRVNTGYFGNVAIKGYDPVAYFTEGAAIEGKEEYSHKWLGAYWRFKNAEHMQMFAANPQQFAPQYGGHCATGMAVHGGLTTDIDPEAFAIVDGKLYLNYSSETAALMTDGIVTIDMAEKNWTSQKSSD